MPSNRIQHVLGATLLLSAFALTGCGGSRADRADATASHDSVANATSSDAATAVQPDADSQHAAEASNATNAAQPQAAAPPAPVVEIEPIRSPQIERSVGAAPEPNPAQPSSMTLPTRRVRSTPKMFVAAEPPATGAVSPGTGASSAAVAPQATAIAPFSAAAPSTAPSAAIAPQSLSASPPPPAAALQPLMAAPEPTGADAPMTAAAEPEPEPAATATPSAAVKPTATAPSGEYTLVKVFYGTDRQAIADAALHPLGRIPWSTLTAAAGGLALLLLVILCFARRSGALRLATGTALVATIALGVCAYQIPRNTKPETAATSLAYGNGRGELQFGICEVSIPKDHEVGQLESPSITSFEFNEDPEKHVVLMSVQCQEPDAFYDQVRQRVAESQSREAFVFVHGYNVTFENAARRTAQLAHDLKFDGAPIFYSWPSQGGLLQYTVDETNVVWTVPHLKDFLLAVAQKTDARRVHLIAHSMGNRALTAALAQLATESRDGQTKLFHEVLLTAPDIDADIFRRDIVPAIVKTANRVTLYASSHDAALEASKQVHGYPRAGESGANIVVLPGIDTIDVSAVDTSLVGHSYYGDSDSVLVDMAQLLHEEKPPDRRARLRATTLDTTLGTLRYWVFLAERLALRSGEVSQ